MIWIAYNNSYRRRGTVLVMVVTVLALLFIIVTGFLASSRVQEQMSSDLRRGEQTESIISAIEQLAESAIIGQMAGSDGKIASGDSQESWATIPGERGSEYLASLEPVYDESIYPDTLSPNPYNEARVTNSAQAIIPYLNRLTWPAVTSFEALGVLPSSRSIIDLIPEFEFDTNEPPLGIESHDNLRFFTVSDLQAATMAAFNDATGDGIPDSDIILARRATLLANSMAGKPVMLPGADALDSSFAVSRVRYRDSLLGMRANAERQWRRFLQDVRFTTASRIVAHGGMIDINAARTGTRTWRNNEPANLNDPAMHRKLSVDLFNSMITDRTGGQFGQLLRLPTDRDLLDEFFNAISATRSDVESIFRWRDSLPAPLRGVGDPASPFVAAVLMGDYRPNDLPPRWRAFRFPQTFGGAYIDPVRLGPTGQADQPSNLAARSQRMNLAEGTQQNLPQARLAAEALSLRPALANSILGTTSSAAERQLARRKYFTTANYSDELALKQTTVEPVDPFFLDTLPVGVDADRDLRLFRGETKFYLGEIGRAFRQTSAGVWEFVGPHVNLPANIGKVQMPRTGTNKSDANVPVGTFVIEKLARYFGEMLSSYSGFASNNHGNLGANLPAARRAQAFMLAVNAVAFAAPRSNDGWIDPVVYTDTAVTPSVTYVGYSPQPFFTEAIAHLGNQAILDGTLDPSDPDLPDRNYAFAVELFNPHDSLAGDESHDLNLEQFRVVLLLDDGTDVTQLSTVELYPIQFRMPGRTFLPIAWEYYALPGEDDVTPDESNQFFTNRGLNVLNRRRLSTNDQSNLQNALTTSTSSVVRFRLERRPRSAPVWYVVDEVFVGLPGEGSSNGQRWSASARDATPAPFFGVRAPDNREARWGMMIALENNDSARTHNNSGAPYAFGDSPLGNAGNVVPNAPSAPQIPLITMNASPARQICMYGNAYDRRPSSYPTTGFMLMLPRFSHTQLNGAGGTVLSSTPMSARLYTVYNARNFNTSNTPVDFGHIPVFDNNQANNGYFSESGPRGKVPWGMLVFDYFTTIDPDMATNPDYDPLRIPGRIDINNASWTVLAQLPMMGPVSGHGRQLPLRAYVPYDEDNPSPAQLAVGNSYEWPSSSFWDPALGVFVGDATDSLGQPLFPRLPLEQPGTGPGGGGGPLNPGIQDNGRPRPAASVVRYRLGDWLAQTAAAYRDRIQNLPGGPGSLFNQRSWYPYSDAFLRNLSVLNGGIFASYRDRDVYDVIRGQGRNLGGFLTIGELLNVKGWDGTEVNNLPPRGSLATTTLHPNQAAGTAGTSGDYLRAVSTLVLLDSHYLTTRSNTFTIYTSLIDRSEDGQSRSVRSQKTIDRGNLLPLIQYRVSGGVRVPWLKPATGPGGTQFVPVRITNDDGRPAVISERRGSYFNTSEF